MIFVFLVLIVAFGAIFNSFKSFQEDKMAEIKNMNFQKIRDSLKRNIELNYNEHYTKEMVDFTTPVIIEAVVKNDRAALLSLTKDAYEDLKKEDAYLQQVHYHRSDGLTLLRLHKIDSFGDNIAAVRPMVGQIHREQKAIYGFELGKSALSYRVFQPLFFEGRYVGALEFGISPKKAVDLVTYFNKVSGLLVLKGANLEAKEKTVQYENLKEIPIAAQIPKEFEKFCNQDIHYLKNELYTMYVIDALDYSNNPVAVGKFAFFNDLSADYQKDLRYSKIMIMEFLILMILVMGVIHFGFRVIISKLEDSHSKLTAYTKLIDENVITSSADLAGTITEVSEAFCGISGYTKEELIGKKHSIVRHPEFPAAIYQDLWKSITAGDTWSGEIKNLKKDGEFYWVKATISPVYDKVGKKIGYTSIRQDITDKKIIEEISITDGLTNIYNRRYFNETFPKIINSSKREDELVSFLIMDIDHFKQYNDNYGHQKGDDVLIKFAACLKQNLKRADDTTFRLGGEEFGMIFKADDEQNALEFADSVRQSIEDLQIIHEYSSAGKYITASMGLVCKRASQIANMDEVFKEADDLLYKSKESGRNRVSMNKI